MDPRLRDLVERFPRLNAERRVPALLEQVAKEAADLLDADRATVFLLDPEKRELVSQVALGTDEVLSFDARLGVAGAVAMTGRTLNVEDVASEARFYQGVDAQTGYETRTILAAALKTPDDEVLGTFQVLNKRKGAFTGADALILESLAALAATALVNARLVADLATENAELRTQVKDTRTILGTSPRIREIVTLIEEISDTSVTVLVTGESGTGKEVIARAIHHSSRRAQGPFVALNCAALPDELVESELFGIEKGVATGVDARAGKFEQANGGTLFLDEIGDLGADAQAKILRALQERVVDRVGGRRSLAVDVRVVAATNRDLEAAVAAGSFRGDLYFRLKVIHVATPALREIPEDIPLLATHFLARACRELGREEKRIPPAVMRRLEAYAWPGNVRELENEMMRLAATVRPRTIAGEHLSPAVRAGPDAPPAPAGSTLKQAVAALEKRLLTEALAAHGTRTRAAQALGLSRQGLLNKLKRYGLGNV